MEVSRQQSTLALLRRLLAIADPSVPGYMPDHFVQLCDGITFYAVLRVVAPPTFPPTTITAITDDDGEEATATLSLTGRCFEADAQMRRANLSVLLRRVATYAHETMGPSPTAPSVTEGLDAICLADLAGDGSEAALAAASIPASLMQLAGVAVTLVVLSGLPIILSEVKALPRQDQVVLSNWVRELMGEYDLKPRRHVAAHATNTSSSSTAAGAAPASGGGEGGSPTKAAGGAAATASSPAASPTRPAPVPTPAGPPPAATAAAASAPPPPSTAGAAAAPIITATTPTVAPVPALSAAVGTSAPAPRPTAGDAEDEGFYRNATYQLRNELADVRSHLAALQDECRIAKEDKATAENKYRLLLGDQAKTSTSVGAAASAASAASGASAEQQKEMIALWQERCKKKDETIATLTTRMEEQAAQVTALKDAAAAHEMALQTLRRRLKTAEEGVMVKSEERREALEKLAVAEDKLAAQMKARLELENEVDELHSRVLVLTVEQDRMRGVSTDETQQMNSSFVSNGSVDRVMSLENELDEVRQQRDSLQRQVGILQRQVAAMPAPVADVSSANDTWRAQLRQVEREREDLRQQLTTALERNVDLQQQLAVSNAAATAAAVTNLNFSSSRHASIGAEGGVSAAAAAAGVPHASAGENNDLDGSSLSADSPRPRLNSSVGGKTRDAARREQVILSSLLLQYSYRNLLLQQHETLLHKDRAEAETARQHQVEEHLDIARHTPSSLLTKQRRDVEQGLLESVLHGAKLRMMRVEQ